MSQTHALTYWTETDRGTDEEHRALEAVVCRFETELDALFFGWLVDYRAYVMHGRLVFRCEVRARGRTASAEVSIATYALLHTNDQVELEIQYLPLLCVLKLAALKTKECQS